ncbi:MAG: zf-HC2 domain-containing protein [Candidatus Eisenbacteria bacterium]
MNRCHQAAGIFGAYWDRETTVAERDWLEGHFKTCPRCHSEYEQLAATLSAVTELPRHEVRPDFTQRVLVAARAASAVADSIRVPPQRSVPWVPVAATAALLLVVGVSYFNVLGPHSAPGELARNQSTSTPSGVPSSSQVVASVPLSHEPVADPRVTGVVAVVTDSLFDHTADVEFMLEPVQLRRGRAHTGSRLPDGVQGDQVVITF